MACARTADSPSTGFRQVTQSVSSSSCSPTKSTPKPPLARHGTSTPPAPLLSWTDAGVEVPEWLPAMMEDGSDAPASVPVARKSRLSQAAASLPLA
eukprot:CAMPEP_0178452810 /NCGR_PEP_ID=MMETSP0689_2-20121128/44454_1 /TAXON_ID=160604 /ORGANISM="Amphidinium massartii, Strain CS-259" /LENGTH=95 /DNA_ID=CAMNT_0020078563 /DNA_START=159 /DNA_END=443 /DNA_ORIENTATION=+